MACSFVFVNIVSFEILVVILFIAVRLIVNVCIKTKKASSVKEARKKSN